MLVAKFEAIKQQFNLQDDELFLYAEEPDGTIKLRRVIEDQTSPPFYQTASTDEWIDAFTTWANRSRSDAPPLSDKAMSCETLYEEELKEVYDNEPDGLWEKRLND